MTTHAFAATMLLAAAVTLNAQAPAKKAATPNSPHTVATYAKDLPAALLGQAKVTEAVAAKTAIARVPNGTISSVELERENGKLLYSYDIKIQGKPGIEEVQVDAVTGANVGKVVHESAVAERVEAGQEEKEKKAAVGRKPPPSR